MERKVQETFKTLEEAANKAGSEAYKRRAGKRVEAMLYLSHELRQAYHLKERFYEVLDAKEPEVSAKLMGTWILEAQNSGLIEYENCGNTFVAWGKGILNSFKYRYTNGFTEGCNNKNKVLKRNAHGYMNFKMF